MTTEAGKRIRVMLADDHTTVRMGVRTLLETTPSISVVADASDGLDAVRVARECNPDVVVLDVAMPGMNGIEVAREIRTQNERVCIVILSMHGDRQYVVEALRAGARGYV